MRPILRKKTQDDSLIHEDYSKLIGMLLVLCQRYILIENIKRLIFRLKIHMYF